MNDVFGAMVHDVLLDLHNLNKYNCLLAVAVTIPHSVSKAGRKKAWSVVYQQVMQFANSLLSRNRTPTYIGMIPEGVAATRELCQQHLRASPLRVMTVDSGEGTSTVQLDPSQAPAVSIC